MNQKNLNNDKFIPNNSISILRILKKEVKQILLFPLLFLFIGILYIFNKPKEYVSVGKIMPEVSYKASNGMGGLYDILKKYNGNIDLYNTEITKSELYDEIIKTEQFYDYILTRKVQISNNKKESFKNYCNSRLDIKDFSFQKNKMDSATANRIILYNIIQNIQKRIIITTIKRNNLTLVTVKMPDAAVAADVANYTMTYLMEYITKYRVKKANIDLLFVQDLLKNISKDSPNNQTLNKELQISLVASTIQMKLKIQEDTPVFQILEKAQIPALRVEQSKTIILTSLLFIGLLIGIIIAILRNNNYKVLLNY